MASPCQSSPYLRSHESEWIYSSPFSTQYLTPMNDYIHQQLSFASSLSWCSWRLLPLLELYIAMCGYAFNPVMFPIWPLVIYKASFHKFNSLTNNESFNTNNILWKWWKLLFQNLDHQQHSVALRYTTLYLASVVVTLIFTEIGKAFFSTSRPKPQPSANQSCWTTITPRKYEKMVASFKSKHSFPSGDCAQAMNLCLIVSKYIMATTSDSTLSSSDIVSSQFVINLLLFGIFLPSVAFARVYFRCHWIEDCIGGVALSWILHMTILPEIAIRIQY